VSTLRGMPIELSGFERQLQNAQRCKDTTPISAEAAREMLKHFIGSGPVGCSATDFDFIQTRLALDQSVRLQESIEKLDRSSSKLSKWLLGLTVVLVVMTGVLVWLTVVLVKAGH
jgi:hypothetical protein